MNSLVNTLKRGRGGRSSFSGLTATIFNGSGFLAENLVARLGNMGTQLVLAHRSSVYHVEKCRIAGDLGQVYFSGYNLKDEKSLYEAMKHSNIVVNTIGKESETSNFSFEDVHVEGPRRMARIAKEVGVEKFIHISALNADPNPTPICLKKPSQFYKTKYFGEQAVLEEFPEAIIFRPSDMVGDGDTFISHFCALQRCKYIRSISLWDYYDGVEKQPVWVKDVVSGIVKAIENDVWNGKIIQAVGPFRYNFYDLIEYMRAWAGQGQKYDECEIKNLRYDWVFRSFISLSTLFFKYPFITWERVERDCTSDFVDPKLPTLAHMGVQLTPLEKNLASLCHLQPRFHRVEIPYSSALQIDLPKRLNLSL